MLPHQPDHTTLPTVRELPNMPTERQPAQQPATDVARRQLSLRRRLGAGVIALVSAVLLVLLFPRTLPAEPASPMALASTSTTATSTPTPVPTPLSPAQAWGAQTIAHYPLTQAGGTFVPTDIAPDGSFMVGYTRPSRGDSSYSVAALTLPQDTVRSLFPLPASAAPPVVKTDGTYAVWLAATTAPSGQIVGFSDVQTGMYHLLAQNAPGRYNPAVFAVAHGNFFWSPTGTAVALHMTALATMMDTSVAPPAGFASTPAIQVVWPRLVYHAADDTTHVYDLATRQDSALSAIPATATPPQMHLTAMALFWLRATTAGNIIERCDLSTADAPATPVVTLGHTSRVAQFAATDRALAWNNGTQLLAWDTEQRVLIALGTPAATMPTIAAQGALLWYGTDQTSAPGIDIIDTGRLAAHA